VTALHVAYIMPGKPGSFGGVLRLFIERYGQRKAKCYLLTQETNTLHKTYSKGIADLYQANLVDLLGIVNYNASYCCLLTCIDIFTKRAWTIPLHSKSGREVTEAFGKILALSDRRSRMLQTDKGTKFLNATFQRMLRDNDIHWYNMENKTSKGMCRGAVQLHAEHQDVALFHLQERSALYGRAAKTR